MPEFLKDISALGLAGLALIAIWKIVERYAPAPKNPLNGTATEIRDLLRDIHTAVRANQCGYGQVEAAKMQRLLEMANANQKITDEQESLTQQGVFSCRFDQGDVRMARHAFRKLVVSGDVDG